MQPPDGAGTATTLAWSRLLLGDTDPSGVPSLDAWKQYGYNIDGVRPGDLAAFCSPAASASASVVHEEGASGIENAFGHLILPLLQPPTTPVVPCVVTPCPQDEFKPLISIDRLGSGTSYDPLPAQVAMGGDLGHSPVFDGTDVWPVVQGTTVSLPESYLVNDTWVSGALASLSVSVDVQQMLTLDVHHAVLTMKLDQTRKTATGGMLSGVIPTVDLQRRVRAVAGQISLSLCSGTALENVLTQIAQASDIMQDGTQDPSKTCDGISIGLGFEARVVQLGPTVPAMTTPDPCVDDAGPAD